MSNPELDTLRLAAIVNSSDDAIISKDLDGVITSWNRAAERMFGFTAEEAIGKSIRLIVPPDRQEEEDGVLAKIRQGIPVEHFETIRQRKDGSQLPISLSVSPMRDARGRIVGASKIARDITERKEAQQQAERSSRYATYLANISATFNRSLNYEETLNALASVAVPEIADWCAVDVVTPEDGLKRLFTAHVDPAKVELANEVRRQYGSNPESPYSAEHVIRTGTSALIPAVTLDRIRPGANGDEERIVSSLGLVSYLCVPMISRRRVIGAITLATAESGRHYSVEDLRFVENVAARAALAVDNAQAYEAIQVANRLKDEFLATLSHELRTPLNAVLGYARMLRSGVVAADKIQHALDVLERNATSLTHIVEDVLDISRITSGKVRLQMQAVSLTTVVNDAVATVQPAADAKDIRIEYRVDPGVKPISADPDRLQQVIWNLMANAVKFTPRGGRVRVRLAADDSYVTIEVEDSGIGIPAAFLQNTFERFWQAEGGTTRRHGGLGLGLAIARHIVEMHGGTISVASEGEGRGTTFSVRLPLMSGAPFAVPELQTQRRTVPMPVAMANSLTGVRVLVVDDDDDALDMLSEILERAGASVETASSADRAFDILAGNPEDVMISDIGMPMMDGFDLIQRVRGSHDAATREIPAIAVTAYARSEDRTKAMRAGFDKHLAKPVDPSELVAAVAGLVRGRARVS